MYLVGAYFDTFYYKQLYYVDDLELYEDRMSAFSQQTFNLTV